MRCGQSFDRVPSGHEARKTKRQTKRESNAVPLLNPIHCKHSLSEIIPLASAPRCNTKLSDFVGHARVYIHVLLISIDFAPITFCLAPSFFPSHFSLYLLLLTCFLLYFLLISPLSLFLFLFFAHREKVFSRDFILFILLFQHIPSDNR